MAQAPAPKRVSGGIPWWLWLIMVVIGGGIAIAVIIQLTPPDPMAHFDRATSAYDANDMETLKAETEIFNQFDGLETHKEYLAALGWLATSRPLKALPVLKKVADDPAMRKTALVQLGQAYLASADFQNAVAAMNQAVEEDASALQAHAMLTRALLDLGALHQSIRSADALIEAGHALSTAHRSKGLALFRMGKYAEAVVELDKALEADPADYQNETVAIPLTTCLIRIEQYEKLLDFIAATGQTATEGSAPSDAVRARALLKLGKLEEAFTTIDNVVNEIRGNPTAFATLGMATLAAHPDRAGEALEKIRTQLIYMSRDAELYEVLADLAEAVGENDTAELYQQNAVKLREMQAAYFEEVRRPLDDLTDAATCIKRGQMAAELRDFDAANFWYGAAVRRDRSTGQTVNTLMETVYDLIPELIPTLPANITPSETPASSPDTPNSDQP